MRKVYALISVFLLGSALSIHSQVTLTRSSHGFIPGEGHNTQEVEFVEPGMSGEGLVWDFRNLKLTGDPEISSVIKVESNTHNIETTRNSNEIRFLYNFTDYQNEYKGYIQDNMEVIFDEALIKTQYPQTYGTYFEGNFSGPVKYKDRVISNISGTYSTHVDATGTLLLPGDISIPAIRVKTTERYEKTCNCGVTEIEKYLWYAQNVRYPLFVSSITTIYLTDGTSKVSKRSCYNSDIDESQIQDKQYSSGDIAYSVSPNPFNDQIQIEYTLPQEMKVSIDLYNTQGTKLATIVPAQSQSGSKSITYFIAPYTQKEGTYFINMQFGDKSYSEKIIKSK